MEEICTFLNKIKQSKRFLNIWLQLCDTLEKAKLLSQWKDQWFLGREVEWIRKYTYPKIFRVVKLYIGGHICQQALSKCIGYTTPKASPNVKDGLLGD